MRNPRKTGRDGKTNGGGFCFECTAPLFAITTIARLSITSLRLLSANLIQPLMANSSSRRIHQSITLLVPDGHLLIKWTNNFIDVGQLCSFCVTVCLSSGVCFHGPTNWLYRDAWGLRIEEGQEEEDIGPSCALLHAADEWSKRTGCGGMQLRQINCSYFSYWKLVGPLLFAWWNANNHLQFHKPHDNKNFIVRNNAANIKLTNNKVTRSQSNWRISVVQYKIGKSRVCRVYQWMNDTGSEESSIFQGSRSRN